MPPPLTTSALGQAIEKTRSDAASLDIKAFTGNMEIARELGMDSSIFDAKMQLLALTEPTEYLTLKNNDLEGIKSELETQFAVTFQKYWATGMSQAKAKALATRVCENLHRALMDIHEERFPNNAGAVQMKALKKKASSEKLKGAV